MDQKTKVGLTVIVGIFLLYLILIWAKRIHFFAPEEQNYTLQFDNVAGLLEGDPVEVRGYTVGRVSEVNSTQEAVWVSILIDKKVRLFSDAFGEIQVKELMGGKKIAMWPGTSKEMLLPGTTLQGRTSLDFSTAFSEAGTIFKQLETGLSHNLIADLNSLIKNLNTLGESLAQSDASSLINNLHTSVIEAKILLQEAQRMKLVAQTQKALTNIQGAATSADSFITYSQNQMKERAIFDQIENLSTQGTRTLDQINHLIASLQRVLNQLEDKNSLANRLLFDPYLAEKVDTTLNKFIEVLDQIKKEKIIVGVTLGKGKARKDQAKTTTSSPRGN